MHAHICVGNDAKDVEWYVAVYLGNVAGFHCAFGPVYVLLTLMFFYCALRAHVRLYGKYTFTTLLHHITIPITNCYVSSRSIQSCTCSYVISWKMMANMVMNFTPVLLFTYQIHRASTLRGMASLHLRREPAVHNARASRRSLKSTTTTRYLFTSCAFAEACQVVSCKAMSLKLQSVEHFSHNKLSAV